MTTRDSRDRFTVARRPIGAADADRVHEWASQEQACRFQSWGPNAREETGAFVAEAASMWECPEGPRLVWAAESALDVVGMGELKRDISSCAEIADAVHVDHWGRGLDTEIARLLLATAFADPAVERVQATCDPRPAQPRVRSREMVGLTGRGQTPESVAYSAARKARDARR